MPAGPTSAPRPPSTPMARPSSCPSTARSEFVFVHIYIYVCVYMYMPQYMLYTHIHLYTQIHTPPKTQNTNPHTYILLTHQNQNTHNHQKNRLSKLAAHNTHSGELMWELPLELGVVSSPLVGKSADGTCWIVFFFFLWGWGVIYICVCVCMYIYKIIYKYSDTHTIPPQKTNREARHRLLRLP
jgi:hypothetical protein